MHYGKFATRLLAGTAIVAVGTVAGTAHAQDAEDSYGIQEIIVTAQKREQSIQDVPIAVTSLSGDALAANKIEDVADLTGLVPGLVMRNTAGSLAAISFAMRGVNSNPSAPLQDKQISLNVDGVYIGGSRGTLGELMEVESLEVLRGPQGTLFGRNSTAGAINVTTRNPTGDMAFTQMVGYGNEDQIRTRTTIDTPQMGPFSAYVTYIHDESRGDVRNLGAGTVWDRSNPFSKLGRQTSPKWLGGRNYENVFAALRFDNGGDITATYKFDWSKGRFAGDARVTPVINTATDRIALANGARINIPGNTIGNLLTQIIAAQPAGGGRFGPILLNPNDRRPDVANQAFNTRGFQRVEGHSFVVEWQASEVCNPQEHVRLSQERRVFGRCHDRGSFRASVYAGFGHALCQFRRSVGAWCCLRRFAGSGCEGCGAYRSPWPDVPARPAVHRQPGHLLFRALRRPELWPSPAAQRRASAQLHRRQSEPHGRSALLRGEDKGLRSARLRSEHCLCADIDDDRLGQRHLIVRSAAGHRQSEVLRRLCPGRIPVH